jgi:hypothetical protein
MDPLDNRLSNLRLIDKEENMQHWRLVSKGDFYGAQEIDKND